MKTEKPEQRIRRSGLYKLNFLSALYIKT